MTFKTLCRIPILFFMGVSFAVGQTQIPDTSAGHALRAWMDALNGGNRADIEKYVKDVDPTQSVEAMMSFRSMHLVNPSGAQSFAG